MVMNRKVARMEDERRRCADAIARIKTAASTTGRELTDDDKHDIEGWEAAIASINRDLAREHEMLEAERAMVASRPPRKPDRWPGEPDDVYRARCRSFETPESRAKNSPFRPAIGRGRYAELFPGTLENDGFDSFGAWMTAVAAGTHHPDLRMAMGEGSGPAGGFTVPTEFSAQWLDASYENEIIRPRATVYPMTSDSLRIPGFDTSDNSSGALFGGFVSQWLPESGEADVVDPKFRRVELRAKKLALFSKASSELVADGVGFDRQLSGAMAEASAWNMDYAFLNGTGAGQPLGILHDPSLIAVAKENAQDADTITYQNLVDMFGRLHPKCVPNSIWVFTVGAIPQLLTLNLPIGVGGAPVPVLSQAGGTFTVLTRPCFFTEKTPALGDQGDALLVDCSQYGIGLRKDLVLERSQHIYWSTDEIGFRGIVRCDGQGLWSSAFTPRNGSSLSWCVTLAARA